MNSGLAIYSLAEYIINGIEVHFEESAGSTSRRQLTAIGGALYHLCGRKLSPDIARWIVARYCIYYQQRDEETGLQQRVRWIIKGMIRKVCSLAVL